MRIAITGASGNIGTALLRRLSAGGEHQLVAIARRIPDGGAPYDAASWHSVDLAADDAAARLAVPFTGVDAVVHLAWAFQPSHDVAYLRRLGVGGTAAALQAARTAGVRHLVHMSSVGAYSAAPHRRVDESAARDGIPTLAYSRHKAEAERLLDDYEREATAAGGPAMLVSRLRPGFVVQPDAASGLLRYGLPGFVPARIVTLLPVLPLDRRLSIPLVHSDDLADGIVRVVERRAAGRLQLRRRAADHPRRLRRGDGRPAGAGAGQGCSACWPPPAGTPGCRRWTRAGSTWPSRCRCSTPAGRGPSWTGRRRSTRARRCARPSPRWRTAGAPAARCCGSGPGSTSCASCSPPGRWATGDCPDPANPGSPGRGWLPSAL